MFGWEFPPHISGGLGTACYGLTNGLSQLEQVELTFVVPKAFGDEKPTSLQLVGANEIPVMQSEIQLSGGNNAEYIEVDSLLVPYVSEEEFWSLKSRKLPRETKLIKTDDGYRVNFSGGYHTGLMDEIRNYALIAPMIAKQNCFDIIHAHDWLTFPAGIAAKKTIRKPLVVHVHATEFDRSGEHVNPRIYAVEREGMEMADHIIAVSGLTKRTIVEKYGIRADKISVVYNAIEPAENIGFNHKKKGNDEKIVTFLGRITFQKGPEYFIEAAALVIRKMKNVRFVMAGSGDLMNSMIARVAELGIGDRFHFTGFLKEDDVHHLLKMTDVFVMPSVSEPFGIVPLEAMQFNVPVIISNQSGVSEIIEHAIKIDFWDTFAMADSIYGLLNYHSLSDYFRSEGKMEVDGLEWVNSAKRVVKVYKKLTKAKV